MKFEDIFGVPCETVADAPGRVNMLGEHTDYNDGFVLPTAITQRTQIMLAQSRDGALHARSAQFDADQGPSPCAQSYIHYLQGCCESLRERGYAVPGVYVYVDSAVPVGVGLSSSAALEVAMLRALRQRFSLPIDDVEVARIAQAAEINYAGVRCGIMDQMAASLGAPGCMLFLDTRSLVNASLPLPKASSICVLDSGTPRSLAGTAFNERRRECEQAAALLGVPALRDVTDVALTARLPAPLDRRARHVISENARVLRAAQGVQAGEFGHLMNASHASLRDDFEVSVASLDTLVGHLQKDPDVYGARLTGAGFGGACVALVKESAQDAVAHRVLEAYAADGYRGSRLV